MEKIKVLALGDSITLGLGVRGKPYPVILSELLSTHLVGIEVVLHNEAVNGCTIALHERKLPELLDILPDLLLIYNGSIEAKPVPDRNCRWDLMRFLPRRYQQPGWLDPRPYLPARVWKRIFYAVPESFLRSHLKLFLMKVQGSRVEMEREEFRKRYSAVVSAFRENGTLCVLCSLGPIGSKFFPGAHENYEGYNATIRTIAEDTGAIFADIFTPLKAAVEAGQRIFLLDEFHPNEVGHNIIAKELFNVILPHLAQMVPSALTRDG